MPDFRVTSTLRFQLLVATSLISFRQLYMFLYDKKCGENNRIKGGIVEKKKENNLAWNDIEYFSFFFS